MYFRQGIQSHPHLWPSLLVGLILCFSNGVDARAGDVVESVGDILQYVLPATAAGITIVHKDGQGAWQLAESAALAMGVTYGLKYSVDETRPEGGSRSFPSAHTSISFSAARALRWTAFPFQTAKRRWPADTRIPRRDRHRRLSYPPRESTPRYCGYRPRPEYYMRAQEWPRAM